jgi:hypothetical protein
MGNKPKYTSIDDIIDAHRIARPDLIPSGISTVRPIIATTTTDPQTLDYYVPDQWVAIGPQSWGFVGPEIDRPKKTTDELLEEAWDAAKRMENS